MRIRILRMFLCSGAIAVMGCASDQGYDPSARYLDNGVMEMRDTEWRYIERRQEFEVESFRSSGDPWQYPAWRHSEIRRRRDLTPAGPDTSYRRKERSDTRDRHQQHDSSQVQRPQSDDFNPRGPQNNHKDKKLDRSDRSEERPSRHTASEPSERVRRR